MTHSIEQDHVTKLANVDAEKPATTIQSCEAHNLIASSDQQRSQHSAQAEFGEAGGAAGDCRPKSAKRVQTRGHRVGAKPGALREARQGAFLRHARGSGWRVQRHLEGRADPASRFSEMAGAKRHPAALFAAHPQGMIRSFGRPDRKCHQRPVLTGFAKQSGMVSKASAQPVRAKAFVFDFVVCSVLR